MNNDIPASSSKNYDSAFCGSIPIQLINLIQPHGLLIVLDKSFNIVQLSENSEHYLHVSYLQLLKQSFISFIASENEQRRFSKKISSYEQDTHLPYILHLRVDGQPKRFACDVHIYADYFLLEIEPVNDDSSDITFIHAYQDIRNITAAMQQADDIVSMSKTAAENIRRFSGFDRVMIYRFDSGWNGTVIAEDRSEDMEHFLNLTFPASDIPKQARELYFKNPYRLVPNIDFEPVRLYPVVNPIAGGFTDLSGCSLRGVAQVHREYLNNMKVKASMSTRIIVDGKLWGLISCHHKTPFTVSFETRYTFEVLSELISSQISARQRAERLNSLQHKRAMELRLIDQIFKNKGISDLLEEEGDTLLSLFEAGGASILINDHVSSIGVSPEDHQVRDMLKWLLLYKKETLVATHELPHLFNKALNFREAASGLLALQFSHTPVAYLLLYRPEIVQMVNWGGNPNRAIQFEDDGKAYHPRNSFKKWKEKVRNTSTPWEEENINIAHNLRTMLVEKQLINMQE